LDHVLKDAKRHHRSISIALLDLRNAFGEVDHQLINTSLNYHDLPNGIIDLFNNIYSDNFVRVSVINETTNPIKVCRGMLQGDPCSPLLFNLTFNTLMMTLKQKKYSQLGYLWSTTSNSKIHRSWLQFALLIGYNDKSVQVLLNVFQAWCQWSRMQIRLDKCSCFGMRLSNNLYQQYAPRFSLMITLYR
jgi:hypothetical protein